MPGPHKSLCKRCICLGEDVLQLDPLRLMFLLEYLWCSLKDGLKGEKMNLDKEEASTAFRYEFILFQVTICVFLIALGF
jgi:hypothetical protein